MVKVKQRVKRNTTRCRWCRRGASASASDARRMTDCRVRPHRQKSAQRKKDTDTVSIMVSGGARGGGEERQTEAEGREAKGGSLSASSLCLTVFPLLPPQATRAHTYMHTADLLEVQALADRGGGVGGTQDSAPCSSPVRTSPLAYTPSPDAEHDRRGSLETKQKKRSKASPRERQ